MILKYYSEKTNKFYPTVEECQAAEAEWDKANEAKIKEKEAAKADAEEIKKAYEEFINARKKYNNLVNEFVKKHKSYHLSITVDDFFDNFCDNLFFKTRR